MRKLYITLWGVCLASIVWGQNARIPSPEEFLGYPYGSRFTFHHRMVDYFEEVAKNSPFVKLQYYGQTTEGRPLLVAYVSSPENLAQLDNIRQNHLQRAGFLKDAPSAPSRAVVWLNFNIHGNESASTTAVMPVLYSLATQSRPEIAEWLRETVVILDPCVNPDGYDRYVNWYQQQLGSQPDPDPSAREHREPWPGGRFNHYLFDLNRDWAWQTQHENQQRIALYRQWMPHVHVDFHEMGYLDPYFFGPSAKPIHQDVTAWQREFQRLTAQNHQRYFDKEGWLYFGQEVYDLFYPSYGDTYPMFNGAVGFTYEQGGSGRAGVKIARPSGDTLTLYDRYLHHYTTALSTVEIAHLHREKLIREFERYFQENRTRAFGPYQTFVVKGQQNPERLARLKALLDRQQIVYGAPKLTGKPLNGYDFFRRSKQSFTLEAEDLLISCLQNQGRLVKVLFEPDSYLEDSLTYDLTAWALPYAYQLESYALTEKLEMQELARATAQKTPAPAGNIYLLRWQGLGSAALLGEWLTAGGKAKVADEPFALEGQNYAAGTILLLPEFQSSPQAEQLRQLAQKHQQDLHPVLGTQMSQGKDFGSSVYRFLKNPRVALVMGDGVSPTDAGSTWFLLEQELKIPLTRLEITQLRKIDLSHYDWLCLPSGDYADYRSILEEYLNNGGKIVALDDALDSFADAKPFKLKKVEVKEEKATPTKGEQLRKYQDRQRQNLTEDLAGAIYRVRLDASHPLAFGMGDAFFTIKNNRAQYAFLPERNWTVGFYPAKAHVTGYVGGLLKNKFDQTLAIGVENVGQGKIVYFSDSPFFRNFWESGKLFMANLIYFL
ncbi:MAG: zinc carboxypeptidase [Microscillaceae bacterium]|nr:zinc carboxypeptidase [Microscillaceae bacterium]